MFMSDSDVQPEEQVTELENKEETTELPVKQQLTILAVAILLVFGSGLLPKVLENLKNEDEGQSATIPLTTEVKEIEQQSEEIPNPTPVFEAVSVRGEAAFVWDVNAQRVLYEKNPDKQLPLASITKLMTALLAYEILDEQEDVSVSLGAILQEGESGFGDGEHFTLQDLTDLTLMSSSNDGAFAIATAAGALLERERPAETFVEAMNIRAEELGLSQTYFLNPTGLDLSETKAGAYGSARDTAFLMEYILKNAPDILEKTKDTSGIFYNQNGQYHEAENTNQDVNEIPGLIGSKTGYTTLAGGNLTVAFDASLNRPIVAVVLNSSLNGRFSDILNLVEAARQSVN